MIDDPHNGGSLPGSWAETLALFPHPYLKVSEHAVCDDAERLGLAFYNEIDPLAAATIREAIARGLIAPGVVDERDIRDIRPDELSEFRQVHLFAGGGIWSYALRQAGFPDDRQIWTCSCPCQPFSAAGKGDGFADERHLWPAAEWLIRQCEPELVAGEQVADKGADPWVDLVQADLEALDYAFGIVPLASAGLGAPNPRHRSFWMAHAARCGQPRVGRGWQDGTSERGDAHGVGNSLCNGAEPVGGNGDRTQGAAVGIDGRVSWSSPAARDAGSVGRMVNADCERWGEARHPGAGERHSERGATSRLGNPVREHGERHAGSNDRAEASFDGTRLAIDGPFGDGHELAGATYGLADAMRTGRPERRSLAGHGQASGSGGTSDRDPGPVNGFWANADWLYCRDPGGPRWRPVDAGTFPLAPGHPARVGGLRISGNAINAEVATAFIEAVIDVLEPRRDRKPAVVLADGAPFLAPPGVVRELSDHAAHVAANSNQNGDNHGR